MIQVRGSIPEIIENTEEIYEGNLGHYFCVIFGAKNVTHQYHNFRHMLHVTFLCYNACLFYVNELTKREMRNLLIAALFHDYNHPGRTGDDDLNIEIATRGLKKAVLPEDEEHLQGVCEIIRPTQYPYIVEAAELSLLQGILRDADVAQAFNPAWIQPVVFGLGEEMGVAPIKVLEMQESFISNLKFNTVWGHEMFEQARAEKIAEAKRLLSILRKYQKQ